MPVASVLSKNSSTQGKTAGAETFSEDLQREGSAVTAFLRSKCWLFQNNKNSVKLICIVKEEETFYLEFLCPVIFAISIEYNHMYHDPVIFTGLFNTLFLLLTSYYLGRLT